MFIKKSFKRIINQNLFYTMKKIFLSVAIAATALALTLSNARATEATEQPTVPANAAPSPFTGSWKNSQGAVWTFTDSEVSQPGAPSPRDYSYEDNVARWEGTFEPYAYYKAVLSADGKTFTASAVSSMDGTPLFSEMVFTKQ
jgi:hypothetical protein